MSQEGQVFKLRRAAPRHASPAACVRRRLRNHGRRSGGPITLHTPRALTAPCFSTGANARHGRLAHMRTYVRGCGGLPLCGLRHRRCLPRLRHGRRTPPGSTHGTPLAFRVPARGLVPGARRRGRGVSERLPSSALADAQRILDRAARRLLAARLDGDAAGALAGGDVGSVDDRADEGALLVEGEQIPAASSNGDGGRGGDLNVG